MNNVKIQTFESLKLVCEARDPFPSTIDAYRYSDDQNEFRVTSYVNMSCLSLELAQKIREELDQLEKN